MERSEVRIFANLLTEHAYWRKKLAGPTLEIKIKKPLTWLIQDHQGNQPQQRSAMLKAVPHHLFQQDNYPICNHVATAIIGKKVSVIGCNTNNLVIFIIQNLTFKSYQLVAKILGAYSNILRKEIPQKQQILGIFQHPILQPSVLTNELVDSNYNITFRLGHKKETQKTATTKKKIEKISRMTQD